MIHTKVFRLKHLFLPTMHDESIHMRFCNIIFFKCHMVRISIFCIINRRGIIIKIDNFCQYVLKVYTVKIQILFYSSLPSIFENKTCSPHVPSFSISNYRISFCANIIRTENIQIFYDVSFDLYIPLKLKIKEIKK